MQIGISGHQKLDRLALWDWVRSEIENILIRYPNSNCFSSLAGGADQVFAEIAYKLDLPLVAIIPFRDYERSFSNDRDLKNYSHLISLANNKVILPAQPSDEQSYYFAGKTIAESCDVMIIIWNGLPARGLGGTGDIYNEAKRLGKKIFHINTNNHKVIELN